MNSKETEFRKIWQTYRSSLKGFLHSKVSNAADAEDLLQDILLKTYNNIHTLNKSGSVKAWLYQIANNSIIDHYRKSSVTKNITKDGLWYDAADTDIRITLENCIEPFINALPDDMAKLLHAIDIKGQPQKLYAAENNISYSTLKSRVQKSRQHLLKLFEDCCHFSIDSRGNISGYQEKSDTCKNC